MLGGEELGIMERVWCDFNVLQREDKNVITGISG